MTGDVIVVGGGVIGSSTAYALATQHQRVILITDHREGEASPAAAGMLAPGVEFGTQPEIRAFAEASRDRYPSFLESLREHTGRTVPLDRSGIIRVVTDGQEAPTQGEWLDTPTLRKLEPSLSHDLVGGTLYPHDGAIDPRALLSALTVALERIPLVTRVTASVHTIEMAHDHGICLTTDGTKYSSSHIVLSAGAWTPLIRGLPRILPIEPVRGQMLMLNRVLTERVICGARGYLVPRRPYGTVVGSTMERVGFTVETTNDALNELMTMATQLCPGLIGAPADGSGGERAGGSETRPYKTDTTTRTSWAGLRPATPDLLPIIGRDPEYPALLYACGHSRNGILMAPLTAECITALLFDETPPSDLTPFRVERFTT